MSFSFVFNKRAGGGRKGSSGYQSGCGMVTDALSIVIFWWVGFVVDAGQINIVGMKQQVAFKYNYFKL